MKTYQKEDGSLWAFEETENDLPYIEACISDGGVLLTAEEVAILQNMPPSKEARIAFLQSVYEIDRDKLNKYWLAALIADGAEETARKTAIEGEMTALDAQLEVDILTIIMEA